MGDNARNHFYTEKKTPGVPARWKGGTPRIEWEEKKKKKYNPRNMGLRKKGGNGKGRRVKYSKKEGPTADGEFVCRRTKGLRTGGSVVWQRMRPPKKQEDGKKEKEGPGQKGPQPKEKSSRTAFTLKIKGGVKPVIRKANQERTCSKKKKIPTGKKGCSPYKRETLILSAPRVACEGGSEKEGGTTEDSPAGG